MLPSPEWYEQDNIEATFSRYGPSNYTIYTSNNVRFKAHIAVLIQGSTFFESVCQKQPFPHDDAPRSIHLHNIDSEHLRSVLHFLYRNNITCPNHINAEYYAIKCGKLGLSNLFIMTVNWFLSVFIQAYDLEITGLKKVAMENVIAWLKWSDAAANWCENTKYVVEDWTYMEILVTILYKRTSYYDRTWPEFQGIIRWVFEHMPCYAQRAEFVEFMKSEEWLDFSTDMRTLLITQHEREDLIRRSNVELLEVEQQQSVLTAIHSNMEPILRSQKQIKCYTMDLNLRPPLLKKQQGGYLVLDIEGASAEQNSVVDQEGS